jgi:hypothetical protein
VRKTLLRKVSEDAPIVSMLDARSPTQSSQSAEFTPIKMLENTEDELERTRSFARRSGLVISEIYRDDGEENTHPNG